MKKILYTALAAVLAISCTGKPQTAEISYTELHDSMKTNSSKSPVNRLSCSTRLYAR